MKKGASWQIAFIVGAVAVVLCTSIVLGSAFLTSVSAASAVIVAIIHSLLANKDSSDDRNWAARLAKNYLQISTVLITATICEFLLTIGILVFGIVSWQKARNTVTVKGIVLTAHREPIENATVALERDGSQIATQITNHGSFDFPDVFVNNNTVVVARWHGNVVKRSVTVATAKAGALPDIEFPMSASQNPFRVTFFDIEGYAVGYLLRGELTGKWQHAIPGHPYVAENEEFKYIRGLGQTSLEPKEGNSELNSSDLTDGASGLTEVERSEITKLSQNGKPPSAFSEARPEVSATTEDLKQISAGSDDYGLIIYNPDLQENAAVFWRFATSGDLSRFPNTPLLELYRAVTQDNWPKGFAALRYSITCGDPVWDVRLLIRTPVIRVAVLENISTQPIQIDGFSVRENAISSLRDAGEDQDALQKAVETRKQYFPAGSSLTPGESLLIPLRTLMVYEDNGTDEVRDQKSVRDAWLQKYGAMPYEFHQNGGPLISSIDPAVLHRYAAQSLEPSLEKDFVVGPSVQLVSIYVQGDPYDIREEQTASLVLREGVGLGSCPYLYTRAFSSKDWLSEGTILTGVDERQKKRLQSKELHNFDGFVRIVEKEPEITHLDAIWVEDTDPDGKTTILRPENRLLRNLDSREVVLKAGQSVTVKFRGYHLGRRHKYLIKAIGYFTPAPELRSVRSLDQ